MRALAVLLLTLAALAASPASAQDFEPVTGPCNFAFPRDHGPHPGHKTEWWYYTGSLTGPSGERFGFQFTLFRAQVMPSGVESSWPEPRSAWRSNHILMAHAAVTDVSARAHRQAERVARQALDLAGWTWNQSDGGITFFLRDWTLGLSPATHELRVSDPCLSFTLTLTPAKPVVAHGEGGYSRKGALPESASCYFSIPRMNVSGTLRVPDRDIPATLHAGGRDIPVAGQAWMDHEYSSAPLAPGVTGWDWLSLRLSDGSDLMLFFLRQADGSLSPASAGTLIAPDGGVRALTRQDIAFTPTGSWTSPRSKARYPSGWRLAAPGIELEVVPELADQEMNTPGTTGVNYWEGLTRAKGRKDGKPVTGEGYVELTGYDRAFGARY
jgi:predicted secreted hydrolase